MTSSDLWDTDAAARYDEAVADMYRARHAGPTVDLLARWPERARAGSPNSAPASRPPGRRPGIAVTGSVLRIGSLRTQAERVACARNAARHLGRAGLRHRGRGAVTATPPTGPGAVPFDISDSHLGVSTPYDVGPSRRSRTISPVSLTAPTAGDHSFATSGPANSTSWPGSPGWNSRAGMPGGPASPSHRRQVARVGLAPPR